MKSAYVLHFFAVVTLLLGIYILFGNSVDETQIGNNKNEGNVIAEPSEQERQTPNQPTTGSRTFTIESDESQNLEHDSKFASELSKNPEKKSSSQDLGMSPTVIIDEYTAAWRNRDKAKVDKLWSAISECEKCLQEFVELLVAKKIEKGMLLEVAIKMAALDTNAVLPVFDALITPEEDKSTAIILSEKIIRNGRPELVEKMFDLIYRAKQSGYDDFAQQLTWVISKLENPEGIRPVLDTITGRKTTSPELSAHVTNVYSKVVRILPDSSTAATVITDYYLQANSAEQQQLWPVVRQHGQTLVKLAIQADQNGQNNNVQKYAEAMTELPHLNSVDSLMQLHVSVEYSPEYMKHMLQERVADNPTIKVLHKLEDYMRNPDVKLESRIFAAEGLLAVRQNRQARYILEKVINSTEDPDVDLQAYIGGRL